MSRPPKPVRARNIATTGRVYRPRSESPWKSPLSEPVRAGEAFGEQPHEEGAGQTDDVEVVALDARHERRTATLDRVRPGPSLPLAGGEVAADVARRQRAKAHAGELMLDDLPARRAQAQA